MRLLGCSLLMKHRWDKVLKFGNQKEKKKNDHGFIASSVITAQTRPPVAVNGASRSDTDTRWRCPPHSLDHHLASSFLERPVLSPVPLHESYFSQQKIALVSSNDMKKNCFQTAGSGTVELFHCLRRMFSFRNLGSA